MLTASEVFLAKIRSRTTVTTAGCWQWQGPTNGAGYGEIRVRPNKHYVHRLVVELTSGPIPAGLEVDHLCRNPGCCNPDHLEVVTRSENVLRGTGPDVQRRRHASITHCPQNHAYDELNTYVTPSGTRSCKECSRRRTREWRARNA